MSRTDELRDEREAAASEREEFEHGLTALVDRWAWLCTYREAAVALLPDPATVGIASIEERVRVAITAARKIADGATDSLRDAAKEPADGQ